MTCANVSYRQFEETNKLPTVNPGDWAALFSSELLTSTKQRFSVDLRSKHFQSAGIGSVMYAMYQKAFTENTECHDRYENALHSHIIGF